MATYTAKSGKYTLTLTVTQGTQNIANNTSVVNWSLTLVSDGGTLYHWNDTCPWNVKLNGTQVGSGTYSYDLRDGGTQTIISKSGSTTITHNGDGTKSISVYAYTDMDNSAYVSPMSISDTFTLTTIPRASDIALGVSSFSITSASGNAFSWSITAKSSSFYNRLRYSIGNKSNVSSNKGQGSSSGYFTNQELLSALPSSTSGSLTVYCDTYSDSGYTNLIGTKSVVITVSVNTSYIKPSVSLGNIGINSSPISGYAVAGHSKVQSAWTTTNSSGATSVTTYFTVSTGSLATTSSSSTSGTVVSNVIPSNASNYTLTIYAYAKDSRGAVGTTVSKSITVYGYQPPTANLTAYRTSSSSSTSEDGAGTYAYVTFSGAVRSSVNSQNTIQSTVCTYSGSISGTATNGGHYALADTQTVTFKLTVTDKVTSSTASVTIATASYPLDLYDDGNGNVGAGVGAVARANEFNLGVSLASNLGNYKEILVDITQAEMMAYDSTLTTSSTDDAWFTVLLKMLCVKYPSVQQAVFKGKMQPNSLRFYNVMIYDTSAVSNNLPQYSFGYYTAMASTDAPIKEFGTYAYTYFWHNGVTHAIGADRATNATYADWTETNPSSSTVYYFPFGLGYSTNTSNRSLLANKDLRVEIREGTASAEGYMILRLGNSTDTGVAGNKWGAIDILPQKGANVLRLYARTTSQTRYLNLPDVNGTIVAETVLWTGTRQGGTSAFQVSSNLLGYDRIRIYALVVGSMLMTWEVDTSKLTTTEQCINYGIPNYISNPGGWYMTVCNAYATNTQLRIANFYNIRVDGVSSQTTTQNNSGNYYVYKVVGIKSV